VIIRGPDFRQITDQPEESPLPAPITLARLVDEFVETLDQHGLTADRTAVEQEMRERISAIAERLRVDPQTVLEKHARPGWGRQMSAAVIDQVRKERLFDHGGAVRGQV
jgi:hypothetical protein